MFKKERKEETERERKIMVLIINSGPAEIFIQNRRYMARSPTVRTIKIFIIYTIL